MDTRLIIQAEKIETAFSEWQKAKENRWAAGMRFAELPILCQKTIIASAAVLQVFSGPAFQ